MNLLKKISPKVWCFFFLLLLIVILSLTNIFSSFDLFFYDLYFKLRPKPAVSKDIVIIEISDQTLNQLAAWPLPRDFHASLLEVLGEAGAETVVFDIIFSEATFYDQALSEAIKDEKVYLPLAFHLNKQFKNKKVVTAEKKIVDVQSDIKKSATGIGHINVFVDPDGKIRRIPLFVKFKNKLFPHLALKAAADKLDLNLNEVKFRNRKVTIDDFKIPVSKSAFFVNFPNRWKKAFPHFSYLGILKAYRNIQQGKEAKIDLSKLKGKVCFVGLTAAGTTDLKPIPLEESYPMLGLQASVYNSLLNKDFIQEASSFLNLVIAILIFVLIFITVTRLPPVKSLFLSLGLAILFFLTALCLFSFVNLWIDSFLPFKIIVLVYIGGVIFKFLKKKKNKEILEKELDIAQKIQESFLPKEIKDISGLNLSCYMKPAKFVAGDLYDIVKLDKNKLGVFLADVSGKGASASLIMAQTISVFRILAKASDSPDKVLTELNKELAKTLKGKFITATYLIFDFNKKAISFASAGHMPPVCYRKAKNKTEEINFKVGLPLGIMSSSEYELYQEKIHRGDKIIVYTDGITEARNKRGEEFEVERLKWFLSRWGSLTTQEIKEKLIEELNKFSKKMPQTDDITFVIAGISQ
ncbi:MAG: CHASE2 domain-containing protein [Candidatus Omnitrophica bacterium]|nr:CHASE2 domain-containing protein [Candidatus Omnitrophota bacterium]